MLKCFRHELYTVQRPFCEKWYVNIIRNVKILFIFYTFLYLILNQKYKLKVVSNISCVWSTTPPPLHFCQPCNGVIQSSYNQNGVFVWWIIQYQHLLLDVYNYGDLTLTDVNWNKYVFCFGGTRDKDCYTVQTFQTLCRNLHIVKELITPNFKILD